MFQRPSVDLTLEANDVILISKRLVLIQITLSKKSLILILVGGGRDILKAS